MGGRCNIWWPFTKLEVLILLTRLLSTMTMTWGLQNWYWHPLKLGFIEGEKIRSFFLGSFV